MAGLADEVGEIMRGHVAILRKYVRRVLIEGEELDNVENKDKVHRMEELFTISSSFKISQNR